MKATVLAIALAVVVLLGAILMRGGVGERPASPGQAQGNAKAAGSAENGRHSPEVVLSIKPSASPPPRSAPTQPKLSPLMEQFLSKRDRKALFDRLSALPAPSAEEMYVLAEIMNDCRRLVSNRPPGVSREAAQAAGRARLEQTISDKDPSRAKRLAAYDAVSSGPLACTGFEGFSIKPSEVRALMAKAAENGDARARVRLVEMDVWAPFLDADGTLQFRGGEAMRLPVISDEQLETVRQALASNDPAVIGSAGRLLSSTMAELQIRGGPEQRPIDPRTFLDAWMLAACDAGRDCGPSHDLVMGGCLSFGNCDARDVREYLFFYVHSPQQSQQLYEYQTQITRAIQTGNWSWFQFHRGPHQPNMIVAHPPP